MRIRAGRSITFLLFAIGAIYASAMEIEFVEDFTLATNRQAAIQQLIPGTEDHYYYQCLNFQNCGQYDKVEQTLAAWINRYGHTTRVDEIRNRQALLSYEKDPKATLAFLKNQIGLTFSHQRKIMGQKPTHPAQLDQNVIGRDILKKRAFANRRDLSGFEDWALELLVTEKLSGDLRRDLLRRLQRPDYPGLVQLVNDDLQYQNSAGFGAFEIHKQMLMSQLEQLLNLRPRLLNEVNFVNIYISKLQPGPDADWQHEGKAREAYLDDLWTFVNKLAPAHNSLKANVLFHRLSHDRALGIYDKDRFMEYVKLPRSVPYINPEYVERAGNREWQADIRADFRKINLLPPIGNDEPLVRDILMHFFAEEETYEPYLTYFHDTYLKEVFSETMILNGTGDMEKWYSLLNNPGKYQEIKDRIEIEFAPTDKTFFRPDEPVALDLDIKNVKQLIVKVFEINTMNYYRDHMSEIHTGIDLDGLVAGNEKTYSYNDAPMRRMRRHFEFPTLNRRGVFVIEFIGNGMSSRALIRKGRFTCLERVSAAGHVFTVLDEDNRKQADASIWLSGHEYKTGKDGTVAIPYTASPGSAQILISCEGFTTLDKFDQKDETYELVAGIYVDRESLIKDARAKVMIRPTLTINGVPAALSLIEEPSLTITSKDLDGVSTTARIKELKLTSAEEFVHEFQVPENTSQITFAVNGKIQSLSENKKLDLSAQRRFMLNRINTTDNVLDLHLSRVESGYVLDVLGKSGERMPDRPVTLSLKHRDFKERVHAVVQSDANGRIDLGMLEDIVYLWAVGPEGVDRSWAVTEQDSHTYRSTINGRVGEAITIPYMGKMQEADRAHFSLLEKRSDTYLKDWLTSASISGGFMKLTGLPAGTYDLLMKEKGTRLTINITPGDVRNGYALGANRLLEIKNPAPLQITTIVPCEDELRIQLENSTPLTRIHIISARFRPCYDVFTSLTGILTGPHSIKPSKLDSVYVSGRNIGDEYRYILERKYARKYPGNMLARPSLLLNPWALRQTEMGTEILTSPMVSRGLYGARTGGGRAAAVGRHGGGGGSMDGSFPGLDFLPSPSVVLVNLKPDKNGLITIPREKLGEGQQIHVVAINPENTVYRSIVVPETRLVARDLRLRDGLDPAKHFTEQKQITVLDSASSLVIGDIATSEIEGYDTVAKVYRLYSTLCEDPALAEFGFVTDWPNLKPAEQKEKFSKYACHELNIFLYKKDPKFFQTVILPYLKNKKDRTFMDHWLIGDGLDDYLKPWAYGQLNIAERILLAHRIKEEAPAGARHLKDLQDLVPPDLDRLDELFMTSIKGSALETGGYRQELRKVRQELQDSVMAMEVVEMDAASPEPRARRRKGGGAASPDADMEMAEELEEDVDKRGAIRQFYRVLDKTQEWAENNYYHLPIELQNASLVTVNPFWTDYANYSGKGPFLSAHMAEASHSFTEIMMALSVMDLPFKAAEPATEFDGAQMTMMVEEPTIAFHKEIKESVSEKSATPLLVSQNFFRASDRYRYENGEKFDKYVTDEFLTHVVYGCQVVMTDPTSSPLKLDVLLQIPQGAIPVNSGFFARSKPVRLSPYSTTTLEYYFYFPAPGDFPHYPVHVARNGQLVAFAQPVPMKVVDAPTKIDTASWDYVSQNGTPAEALTFLDTDNPNRLDLAQIAWRMRDKAFFIKTTELLTRRHVYDHTLWSYSIFNDVPLAIREYLQHDNGFLAQCGDYLDCMLVTIDPIVRKSYQHLEYSPLVNARSHQVGKRRQILNDRVAQQYHSLLKVLSYKQTFDETDRMSLVYYMLLQDRIEEARRFFVGVAPERSDMQIQYDYLQAYLDFFSQDHKLARAIAAKYRNYPVDRWREVFADVMGQIDEIEGKGPAVVDRESREQLQTKLAATECALEFTVESRKATVNYQNVPEATVNYYLMDIELLFSRNPFVQQKGGQFSYIQPNRVDQLKLPASGKTTTFSLPREFWNANVIVEIVAGGVTRAQPYYANSLAVQVIENYGHLKVTNQKTDVPLAKVYIKVYARLKDGTVQFYKDGYTDLRGRFDYASLSTTELDDVDRLAILILSESEGAVIKEANPPKQ